MGVVQINNDEQVEILSPHFQRSYTPDNAWGKAVSAHLQLTGLRGYWPMSGMDQNGDATDLATVGSVGPYPLTYNGNPTYNMVGLAPYIDLDGVGDYLSFVDTAGLNIIGNETYIAAAMNGLTLGGWYYFDSVAANAGLMSKWDDGGGANQRSFMIYNSAGGTLRFAISSNGALAGTVQVDSTTAGVISTWYHIIGRYYPSTEISIFVNGVETANGAAIPATMFNSTSDFEVGGYSFGTNLLNGRASHNFICAAALPDAAVLSLYQHTRALFGV